MDRRADKEYKDGDPRIEPAISPELVMRMLIARMPGVYARVNDVPGSRVVYQRTAGGRLMVIEEK